MLLDLHQSHSPRIYGIKEYKTRTLLVINIRKKQEKNVKFGIFYNINKRLL